MTALLILSFSALEYLSFTPAFLVVILSVIFLELSSVFPLGLESLGLLSGFLWIFLSRISLSREFFSGFVSFFVVAGAIILYTLTRMVGVFWFTERTSFSFGELLIRGSLDAAFSIFFLLLFFIFFFTFLKVFYVIFPEK